MAKTLNMWRQEGLPAIIQRGLKRLIRPFFETNSAFWFTRDLSAPLPEISPRCPVEIDLSSADETIGWLRNHRERWVFNQREVEIGLKEKHYFANVKCGGRIVGYAKVGKNKIYIHDYRKVLAFPRDCVFIYDTYVIPEYRGLRIAPYLVAQIMSFLKNDGVKRLGCHIPPWNIASMRVYEGLGFTRSKYVRYVKLLGLKVFTAKPGIA